MKRKIGIIILLAFIILIKGSTAQAATAQNEVSRSILEAKVTELNEQYGLDIELIDFNTNVSINEVIDEIERVAKEQYELNKYIESKQKFYELIIYNSNKTFKFIQS